MTENEAMKIISDSFAGATDYIFQTVNEAHEFSQKEALTKLLQNPELLDPLLFVLFADNADITDVISYKEYALVMKEKAKKSMNQGLCKVAKAALFISKQIERV